MDILKGDDIQYVSYGETHPCRAIADLVEGEGTIRVQSIISPNLSYRIALPTIICVQRVIPGGGTQTVYQASIREQ